LTSLLVGVNIDMKQTCDHVLIISFLIGIHDFSRALDRKHIWHHITNACALLTHPPFGYFQNIVLHHIPHNGEEFFEFGLLVGFFHGLVHVEPAFANRHNLFAYDVFDGLDPSLGKVLFDRGYVIFLNHSEIFNFPSFVEVEFVQWFVIEYLFALFVYKDHS